MIYNQLKLAKNNKNSSNKTMKKQPQISSDRVERDKLVDAESNNLYKPPNNKI